VAGNHSDYDTYKRYSMMPRPFEPVEHSAFFSECTLASPASVH